jgi:hypothetical protein
MHKEDLASKNFQKKIIIVFGQALGAVGDLDGDHHTKDSGQHILVGGTRVVVVFIEPLLEAQTFR